MKMLNRDKLGLIFSIISSIVIVVLMIFVLFVFTSVCIMVISFITVLSLCFYLWNGMSHNDEEEVKQNEKNINENSNV